MKLQSRECLYLKFAVKYPVVSSHWSILWEEIHGPVLWWSN